jgi:hypothetical protein
MFFLLATTVIYIVLLSLIDLALQSSKKR